MAFKIRRGTDAERAAYTPAVGEPIWTTDTKKLWIGDGSTAGGIAVDAEGSLTDEYLQDLTASLLSAFPNAFNGIIFNAAGSGPYTASISVLDSLTGLQVGQTLTKVTGPGSFGGDNICTITAITVSTNTISVSSADAFTNGGIKFTSNISSPHNGITFTYNDVTGKITANVNFPSSPPAVGGGNFAFNVTGSDSTLRTINNSETLQFTGSNGINVNVNDSGGTTIVNIDGLNVQGGGNANLQDVGWFITGADSTQIRINNDETLQVTGSAGITVTLNDTGAPTLLSIAGSISNSTFPGSLAHYTSFNSSNIISSDDSLVYTPSRGNLSVRNLATPSIFSVAKTTPTNITNIQANTPIAGRATVTFSTLPARKYKIGGYISVTGVTPSIWNGVYSIVSATDSLVIIDTNKSSAYTSGGSFQETDIFGLSILPNGTNPFVTIGGVLDSGDGLGNTVVPGKLRVIDTTDFFADGQFSIVEISQIHNTPLGNSLNLQRARGTLLAPTRVQSGDTLGGITFTGSDGVNALQATGFTMPASATIASRAKETPAFGALSLAGDLAFFTARPGAGYNLSLAMTIDEFQNVTAYEDLNAPLINVSDTIRLEGNSIKTILSNANLDLSANGTGTINLNDTVNVIGSLNVTGTLNVYNIDTLDSSSINIITSAVFNSDVTIENDLTVNNKVYAREFVSTSLGSPEIVSATNFKIRVTSNEWLFATTGDIELPNGSQLSGNTWTAATSDYVALESNNADNSISVGDNTIIVTTNANTVSRNFYFNPDGGLQLPILTAAPVSPNRGFYIADGISWDPDSKSGSVPYPVFYDGSAFNALY